ncbi:hypothetical protein [Aliiroseovarius sp. YM-037]
MLKEIKSVIERSSGTLFQDVLGASALCLMLLIGLHLPTFV